LNPARVAGVSRVHIDASDVTLPDKSDALPIQDESNAVAAEIVLRPPRVGAG